MEAQHILNAFINDENNILKIQSAGDIIIEAIKKGNKVISCGNGGSMGRCYAFAEELTGRFERKSPCHSSPFHSDPTHITCTANDYGYDYIFSRYIEAVGREDDVLLAISTSGNSANVLKAAETSHKKG